jgi:hypothetical protein
MAWCARAIWHAGADRVERRAVVLERVRRPGARAARHHAAVRLRTGLDAQRQCLRCKRWSASTCSSIARSAAADRSAVPLDDSAAHRRWRQPSRQPAVPKQQQAAHVSKIAVPTMLRVHESVARGGGQLHLSCVLPASTSSLAAISLACTRRRRSQSSRCRRSVRTVWRVASATMSRVYTMPVEGSLCCVCGRSIRVLAWCSWRNRSRLNCHSTTQSGSRSCSGISGANSVVVVVERRWRAGVNCCLPLA